jgi:succinate dehydrogenase / fumarate reductase, cytochrome b subunit
VTTTLERARIRRRRLPWPLDLYGSALGKKYVMAVTGMALMAYVLLHMLGNLKLYLGPAHIDRYGAWLRTMGEPVLPPTVALWAIRVVFMVALALHLHAAWSLTRLDLRARPERYQRHTDYIAANFASRTMRWTGPIVGLFIVYHLFDLSWGQANPGFVRAAVYHNVVASFSRWPVAVVYIVANAALGAHLYHGAWSLFQSLGWNHPRWNIWRRWFAGAFALIVAAGNISFPIMVLAGVVS